MTVPFQINDIENGRQRHCEFLSQSEQFSVPAQDKNLLKLQESSEEGPFLESPAMYYVMQLSAPCGTHAFASQLSWPQWKTRTKGFTLRLPVCAVQPLVMYTDLLCCRCQESSSSRNPETWNPWNPWDSTSFVRCSVY